MRIAILILAILGSVLAFGGAACAAACTGCSASVGGEATGNLALITASYGLMGILGLVGGILGFSKLGKGEKTPAAGGLMIGGVALGFILSLVAGLGLGGAIWLIIMGGEFIGIAAILAFVAKPTQSESAVPQPQQYQQPPNDPGQQPPPA